MSGPFTPSSDRLVWAHELGRSSASNIIALSDPALIRTIEEAARAGGARVLDVTVLASPSLGHVPVVTLESANPASNMKHDLRRFLDRIGYSNQRATPSSNYSTTMAASRGPPGSFPKGGMVHPSPDLDECSPISQPRAAWPATALSGPLRPFG